ncbi:MAG: dienelactone hydrolase family protein, partial [Gammaproteobacteria bacterium]
MTVTLHREIIDIDVGSGHVEGVLALPEAPRGIVLFAHGSGSSRTSPRNVLVAAHLRRQGLGTLLMDLLTTSEEWDTPARFDIPKLSRRLGLAAQWLAEHDVTASLPLALFGASTGAAAALQVAAQQPDAVSAVVSRGGRPELVGSAVLAAVCAPTLLIVGGLDTEVLALNRRAL